MWGGDLMHLDILVKNQSLDVVRDQLKHNQINYDVVIDDIQRAIDEANPPITDDDELQIRQGKFFSKKITVFEKQPLN